MTIEQLMNEIKGMDTNELQMVLKEVIDGVHRHGTIAHEDENYSVSEVYMSAVKVLEKVRWTLEEVDDLWD